MGCDVASSTKRPAQTTVPSMAWSRRIAAVITQVGRGEVERAVVGRVGQFTSASAANQIGCIAGSRSISASA